MMPFSVLAVLQLACGSKAANILQKVSFFLFFFFFIFLGLQCLIVDCLPSSAVTWLVLWGEVR